MRIIRSAEVSDSLSLIIPCNQISFPALLRALRRVSDKISAVSHRPADEVSAQVDFHGAEFSITSVFSDYCISTGKGNQTQFDDLEALLAAYSPRIWEKFL